jgi:hypothetical protein
VERSDLVFSVVVRAKAEYGFNFSYFDITLRRICPHKVRYIPGR